MTGTDTGSGRLSTPAIGSAVAVTVPLPTSHAVPETLAAFRQAPPSCDASASSPGGRLIVSSRGESVPVSANFRSSPRFSVAPAFVPALWSRLSDGEVDA